ncbi:MAG TPA: class I SAM-dependent methyltransferase [Anaerolineales bacterium]|nr:class I SAM-dependent methyltransferase [Anaerolineales bacterium]
MSIQDSYNEWSEIYDSNENLTRDLDEKVTREKLSNLRFQSILEIGCGTGKNTIFLAQIGEQVHALDFSEGMIEKAREKVRAANVRFEMADLTQTWNCANAAYDLVVCNLVLEHIQELAHIFSEAARVLEMRGKFFVNELHPFRQYLGTKARFERADSTIEVEAFVHHISDFTNAASASGLKLVILNEYWHPADQGKPPRLVSLLFQKE